MTDDEKALERQKQREIEKEYKEALKLNLKNLSHADLYALLELCKEMARRAEQRGKPLSGLPEAERRRYFFLSYAFEYEIKKRIDNLFVLY